GYERRDPQYVARDAIDPTGRAGDAGERRQARGPRDQQVHEEHTTACPERAERRHSFEFHRSFPPLVMCAPDRCAARSLATTHRSREPRGPHRFRAMSLPPWTRRTRLWQWVRVAACTISPALTLAQAADPRIAAGKRLAAERNLVAALAQYER